MTKIVEACPCCGYGTLFSRGDYEICKVCFWEDDGQDNSDADIMRGGPNGSLSLTQARLNFLDTGISCPLREDLRPVLGDRKEYQHVRVFSKASDGSIVETKGRDENVNPVMIKYLEVESRPVIIKTLKDGVQEAWVWNSNGWNYTPALIGKSLVEGETITEAEFKTRFPEANLRLPDGISGVKNDR